MFKIILLVVAAIVVWLIITQPATSGPMVGEVVKAGGDFLHDVFIALIKLTANVTQIVKGGAVTPTTVG